MPSLYRPVLIESAEQAEALPEGTIIRDPQIGWEYGRHEIVDGDLALDILAGVRPIALVPIEAEEESRIPYLGHPRQFRLVTLWEEA